MKQYFVHCDESRREAVQKVANIVYTPVYNDSFVIVETDNPGRLRHLKGVTKVREADTGFLLSAKS